MNIRIIAHEELVQWHIKMLTGDAHVSLTIICLFGGDRLSCCDEAVVAEENGQIVSVASIAPEGEQNDGRPTIVGLYTLAAYRKKGYGLAAMTAAIERMVERGLTPIHVDVLSTGAKHLIAKLPDELRKHLDPNDQSGFVQLA